MAERCVSVHYFPNLKTAVTVGVFLPPLFLSNLIVSQFPITQGSYLDYARSISCPYGNSKDVCLQACQLFAISSHPSHFYPSLILNFPQKLPQKLPSLLSIFLPIFMSFGDHKTPSVPHMLHFLSLKLLTFFLQHQSPLNKSLFFLLKRTSTSYIWGSTLGMQGTPWPMSFPLKDRIGSAQVWGQVASNLAPMTSGPIMTLKTVMASASDTASQAGGSAGNRYFILTLTCVQINIKKQNKCIYF